MPLARQLKYGCHASNDMLTVLTFEETCISLSPVWSEHMFKKGGQVKFNVTREMLFGKHAVVILQTQTESSGKISIEFPSTACEKWASRPPRDINVY